MNSIAHTLLGGQRCDRIRYHLLLAVCLFAITFQGYRTGFFSVSGGLFIPGQAFLLGMICAAWVGLRGGGLSVAWVIVYGSLLGAHAQRALFSYPERSLAERIDLLVDVEGVLFLGVSAGIFGTAPFVIGAAGRSVYQRNVTEQMEGRQFP